MNHHLPSADQPVAQTVEDVLGIAAVSTYVRRRNEGLPDGDTALFASIPPGDPDYLMGNAGAMVILHFLLPVIFAVTVFPALILGAVPFIAAVDLIYHSAGQGIAVLCFVIAVPIYTYLVFWRIVCRKIIAGIFVALFG